MIEIHNGDSLEVMKSNMYKWGGVFDAIITDPPYNISRDNNFKTMNRAGIDFGEWDKDFDLTSWISVATPLLKKGGNIVIFNDWKNLSYIVEALEENDFEVKDLIRWKKTNPMPRNRDRRFITDYEFAIWAVKKGGKWTFNRMNDTYEIPEIVGGLTPKSEKLDGGHPTQKPIYVMKWILERLTNENDIVLDCFMGSGTACVACHELNRNCVGIELDKTYFEIAQKRIKEVKEMKQKREVSPDDYLTLENADKKIQRVHEILDKYYKATEGKDVVKTESIFDETK